MENEILLETKELLQRLVEAVEKLNSAPSEDTIIAFFALVAAFNCIGFSDVGLSGVGFSNIGLSAVGFSNTGQSNAGGCGCS